MENSRFQSLTQIQSDQVSIVMNGVEEESEIRLLIYWPVQFQPR
jgi:hypothetical protein